MNQIHLLIIDPQNDFCDLPQALWPADPTDPSRKLAPALAVPGAHADLTRLSDWIRSDLGRIEAITATLDHHHRLDIAHVPFWRTTDGGPVPPFSQVRAEDVRAGRFLTADPAWRERALRYLDALETSGRFVHTVWPVHCQIGTWGQCIHPGLQSALDLWEDSRGLSVEHVHKGANPWTEHYSALRAEVPMEDDPSTGLNLSLLGRLKSAETLFVAGEAGSHCVRATVEHLVENWDGDPSRIVLLEAAMSPVGGFESFQAEFFSWARRRGLRVERLVQAIREA